ncbi:tRNA (guanosine(46)-N(7))-methyltransferase TrmB [Methyloceanibacter sp.]|uniref:tRNA (guanine(46)-N(7))-methyltransferase TrmB n=1 Tax=Methyloceanibacter sp. TaxID=1965321 RepID=UPI00351B50A0
MIGEKTEIDFAPPLRSYGRRKAKPLSARKERLIGELLPRLRLDLAHEPPRSLASLFPKPVKEVWLEVGFGSGEHLLWQAERHEDVGFIGCEPFINGMASLLGAVETSGIATIRVHDGDARDVLGWLPDGSIGRIFLLFPDPWPKKRQLKRRLLSRETVKALARVLRRGGEFRFASDDANYAAQALLLARTSGAFVWEAERPADWREREGDWPETRYERKALAGGRKAVYLRFTKG